MTNPFQTSELLKSVARYPVVKGDFDNHPFRGNQWTGGIAGGEANDLTKEVIAASDFTNNPNVEWVPIDAIDRLKEYDRADTTQPKVLYEYARETIDELKQSIPTEGFKEPLIVEYAAGDRHAYLGEGNHRLAAAKELGLSHVPVRVMRNGEQRGELAGTHNAVEVPGYQADPPPHNRVPADMKPSQIGLPTLGAS